MGVWGITPRCIYLCIEQNCHSMPSSFKMMSTWFIFTSLCIEQNCQNQLLQVSMGVTWNVRHVTWWALDSIWFWTWWCTLTPNMALRAAPRFAPRDHNLMTTQRCEKNFLLKFIPPQKKREAFCCLPPGVIVLNMQFPFFQSCLIVLSF